MKIHGVFLLKKQFGKDFREIFEGSPAFHPTLCEIYMIKAVIFNANSNSMRDIIKARSIVNNCENSSFVEIVR